MGLRVILDERCTVQADQHHARLLPSTATFLENLVHGASSRLLARGGNPDDVGFLALLCPLVAPPEVDVAWLSR